MVVTSDVLPRRSLRFPTLDLLKKELTEFYVEVTEAGFGCNADASWQATLAAASHPAEVATLLSDVEVHLGNM